MAPDEVDQQEDQQAAADGPDELVISIVSMRPPCPARTGRGLRSRWFLAGSPRRAQGGTSPQAGIAARPPAGPGRRRRAGRPGAGFQFAGGSCHTVASETSRHGGGALRALTDRIAFQGNPGAYSHQACVEAFPGLEGLACASFEAAIAAVRDGARRPRDAAGGEFDLRADRRHPPPAARSRACTSSASISCGSHANLLAVPGARLEEVRTALSQAPLLGQCANFLQAHGIKPMVGGRHRGVGRGGRREGRPVAARRSPRSSPPRSTGSRCWRATSRTPAQHHALPGHVAASRGRADRWAR